MKNKPLRCKICGEEKVYRGPWFIECYICERCYLTLSALLYDEYGNDWEIIDVEFRRRRDEDN